MIIVIISSTLIVISHTVEEMFVACTVDKKGCQLVVNI